MNVLRNTLMYPNKAWNRMGPRISRWFRNKLQRIDSHLALQFLPPCEPGARGQGIDNRFFPNGCWVVARKLHRSGMLLKHWVCHLQEPFVSFRQPGNDILRLIRRARNLTRRKRNSEMLDQLDRGIARIRREDAAEQRAFYATSIVNTCRRLGFTRRGRVSAYTG